MKKLLLILLCSITVLTCTVSRVFAENFHYKLYNPETKEVSSNIMMTISASNSSYVIGFLTPKAPCLIFSTEDNGDGLLGGKCVIMNDDKKIYTWKEYKPNTFNTELNSIISERKAQGMHIEEEMEASYKVTK